MRRQHDSQTHPHTPTIHAPVVTCSPEPRWLLKNLRPLFSSQENENHHFFKSPPVYPRVKVRVQEEDDHFPPPNDSDSSLFLRVIESLSKQEKENQINSPPSNARITKAYVKSPETKSLSASKGTVKDKQPINKDTKSNVNANSVPPPRAVLSSPDNDGMIGSRNKLNHARSTPLKKTPAEQIKPASQTHKNVNLNPRIAPKTINVNQSPNVTQSSGLNTENRGLAEIMQKDTLKPVVVVVQRQKAHVGEGRKSSSLGI